MAKIAEFDVSKVGMQSDSPVVDQEPKVSAIGMGRDSLEFLDAAKELAGERDASQLVMRHLHPMYYLLCHSMELSLKAPFDGVVQRVGAEAGDQVALGAELFHVEPSEG